ncbi:hypothetical protein [Microlunatus speluncae]|uniref:hypothetical protein n=1 Tax=Microlunatus speluncae TaxID=2594267 RepID=UPI0012662C16|nr:hypothetical protein [Microlunatus speluncae]
MYAGPDPVTGKPNYISESTRDPRQIRQVRTKLQAQVDQQRSAATNAILSYTIERWLEIAELDFQTRQGYEGYIRRNIGPALGDLPISKIRPQADDNGMFQVEPMPH